MSEPNTLLARKPIAWVFAACALASSLGCGASTTGGTGPAGSTETPKEPDDPRLSGVLAAHNQVRANASPAPATPLPALQWSAEDAEVARAYAEKCTFEHNTNRGTRGENLYASSGTTAASEVVASWAEEAASYDYATGKCKGACGHYTQIVWAQTTHVGCAAKTCTTNSPFGSKGSWEIWVCNYSPPGNFIGKKPY
jgi:uncharacterized protein YkwD